MRLSSKPFHSSRTVCALMVIPRSCSISILSSTWLVISRAVRPPVVWINRSASVDLPWSMCAMMLKLRIFERSVITPKFFRIARSALGWRLAERVPAVMGRNLYARCSVSGRMDEALSRLRRIETWARAGYAVRGLVYLLLGGLVIGTGRGVSASAAVETVRLLPAGAMLL